MPHDLDLSALSLEELINLRGRVAAEIHRKQTLADAPARVDELATQVLTAEGIAPGDPWRAPTGAHDSYPSGWLVTHGGKTWESLIPANVWEPGVSGWREVTEPDPDTGEPTYPEWVQPTGQHDAYQTGDRVTFDGDVYESVIDNNTWSPADYPAGWQRIEHSEEPDDD